jgi:putative hydrolase of the HAD superfamily
MAKHIRRIFFDSGKVLVYPVSGDWFVPTLLADRQAELGFGSLRLGLNRMRAGAFLDHNHLVLTEEAEYEQFLEYYRILFAGIPALESGEFVSRCALAKVSDYSAACFYPDVAGAMDRLGPRYRLGIISDAWPSIFGMYRTNGLHDVFDPFVVSSMHGATKAQRTLFDIALSSIDEEPSACLFVDDSVTNCRIAAEKGMQAVVMCRSGAPMKKWGLPAVRDLAELEALLGADTPG